MKADLASLGCQRPGCGGPRSGVCINNLPFEECPDVAEWSEDEPDDQPLEAVVEPASQVVLLPGGRSLDAQACDALLRQRGGKVVALVAAPDVGKTTLIATMYELLHRRRMAALGFAGSETLRGYEERSHLTRLASNGAKPDTQRTSVSTPLNFTHLRVATPDHVSDVVFSDRSGEHFENALARPAAIADFAELHRADSLVLLVDLVRLVGETHLTLSSVRRLFLALDQNGLLAGRRLLLVGTKADLAIPTPRSKKAERALADLETELNRRAAGRFTIGRHVIACRAQAGSTEFGVGMERLLAELLENSGPAQIAREDAWPTHRSELDQLMRGYRSAGR